MTTPGSDIHDYEVCNLINKLVSFIGINNLERALKKYSQSLTMSGPIYRDYYLRHRHPWWVAFEEFFKLEKSGKSVRKHLTAAIKSLAADAKKISILQKQMPSGVRDKYKKDLTDEKRAFDYLFEIQMAWHYYLKGYPIQWYTEKNKPDFLITTPDFILNVECKRISVDASRKIRRCDFYRFVEILLSEINKHNYQGEIDITLKDRLHSSNRHINNLAHQIEELVAQGELQGEFSIPFGTVHLNLQVKTDDPVDFEYKTRELMKRKAHEAHGAIFAKSKNQLPIAPLEITLKSEKADRVLNGMKRRIYEAATTQLDKNNPGLITCFLEDINELSELAEDSGLKNMSNYLLNKKELSHLPAISYCSEARIFKEGNFENFHYQGLIFRNPNCQFKELENFQFLFTEASTY